MSVVVRVENVSKKYQLGRIGTQSLRGDLQRWWARTRGREDPFARIGEENGANQAFWALRDVSFDIHRGEAVGIIGKNGAGKSTLLKILSRITLPTTGRLRVKGRIASLLEVGTGFNPELTGRENIFLNGAILGMTKREVQRKFDEIVDFSGVEKFIDTPVKRYSSGMYVRLAFAVAAHLESEILILDEVLAVGDADFQKKCLGKMDDVAHKEGRTIIFVSHNMQAVKSLCQEAVLLQKGQLIKKGAVTDIANQYSKLEVRTSNAIMWNDLNEAPGNDNVRIIKVNLRQVDEVHSDVLNISSPLELEIEYYNFSPGERQNISVNFFSLDEVLVFNSFSECRVTPKGRVNYTCAIPAFFLNDISYLIEVMIVRDQNHLIYASGPLMSINIVDDLVRSSWYGKWGGLVRANVVWSSHAN